jgi:hypothetical protein
VLIPFTPDCEYQYGEEVLPPEKIERLANSFQKYKIIDLQHEFTKRLINRLPPIPRGKLLKSYISKETMFLKGLDGLVREYPAGTWIISVEITDSEAMKLYEQGALTGLSVTVKEREHADTIIKYLEEHDIPYLPAEIIEAEKGFYKKPKRILMKDVENPVAFTVSLVKQPCVYGAKFCKNSCLIVNENKLKENKILNIKEKIKSEINSFIDGLDVEDESIKEDIVEESEKEETIEEEAEKEEVTETEADKGDSTKCGNGKTKTIYGRKVKVSEAKKSEETTEETESIKEDGDSGDGDDKGDGDTTATAGAGEGTTSGDGADLDGDGSDLSGDTDNDSDKTTSTGSEDEDKDGDKGTSKGNVKKEAKKSDESVETESDKDVLYLAQDDVENLISTTLRRYAEEIEQMVFDGIQEALDDYLFANEYSYKEDIEEEKPEEEIEEPEEEEEEAQKQYATPEMVQSMFDEQFASFKSSITESIKQAQKESIKSYSKAINPSDDGLKQETQKETFKPRVERDFNGCRIRKR